MTPAEVITLDAARQGRRRPPADYGRFPQRLSADELAEFFLFDQRDRGVGYACASTTAAQLIISLRRWLSRRSAPSLAPA